MLGVSDEMGLVVGRVVYSVGLASWGIVGDMDTVLLLVGDEWVVIEENLLEF